MSSKHPFPIPQPPAVPVLCLKFGSGPPSLLGTTLAALCDREDIMW